MDLISGITDGSGQFACKIVVLTQYIVGETLRAFAADARELAQGGNQPTDRRRKVSGHILETGEAETCAAGDLGHSGFNLAIQISHGLVYGCGDQVLQHFRIFRINDFRGQFE